MKKALLAGLAVLALGAAFMSGVAWEYAAQRQEIADIEAVVLEACQIQLKTARRLCK